MKYVIAFVLTICFCAQASAKKVIYRKTQSVDFSETNIDGVARTPDGAYLHQKRGVRFLPLYEVKSQFDKGIRESASFLK